MVINLSYVVSPISTATLTRKGQALVSHAARHNAYCACMSWCVHSVKRWSFSLAEKRESLRCSIIIVCLCVSQRSSNDSDSLQTNQPTKQQTKILQLLHLKKEVKWIEITPTQLQNAIFSTFSYCPSDSMIILKFDLVFIFFNWNPMKRPKSSLQIFTV